MEKMYQRDREHLHGRLQQAFIEEQKKRERQQVMYSGRAMPMERETRQRQNLGTRNDDDILVVTLDHGERVRVDDTQ